MTALEPPSPPASLPPGTTPAPLPPARLGGSFVAFLLCAVVGAAPALGAYVLLRARLGPDRLAFFVLAVFAVLHVGALLVIVPRLQSRGLASVRYTGLLAILVWLLVIGGTMIGVRIYRARAAELAATRALEEARAVDAELASGGFRRIVLDRYVALHDLAFAGGRYYIVGGTQETWLLRSDDGGGTWASRSLDLEFHSPRAAVFVTPDRGFVLASTVTGPVALRTDDGGASWTSTPTPAIGWSVACTTPERCWLAGIDNAGRLHVHVTSDAGRSWVGEHVLEPPPAPARFSEPLCTALPGPGDRILCLSARRAKDRSHGGFALLRTTAADLPSWAELPIDAAVDRWNEIFVASDGTILGFASTLAPGLPEPVPGGVVARSVDATGTFAVETLPLPPGTAPVDVEVVDGRTIYAIAGDLLYRSDDGGRIFVEEPSVAAYGKHGNLFLRKLEFTAPDKGVVIKANGALLVRSALSGPPAPPAPAPPPGPATAGSAAPGP